MTDAKLDLETVPIPGLVSAFADLAHEIRSSIRPGAVLPDPRPEAIKASLVARIRPVIAALSKRATLDDVRPLFESEDDDVRVMAATALGFFDDELRSATFGGVVYGAPTKEALRLLRLARAPDTADPPLDRMSEEQLFQRIVDVLLRLYGTRFFNWLGNDGNGFTGDNDVDMTNRNHWIGEKLIALRELKSRGALTRLLPLLDDPNPVVQTGAATACLGIATDRAIPILEDLTARWVGKGMADGLEISAARAALKNWRAGKPVIWGVV